MKLSKILLVLLPMALSYSSEASAKEALCEGTVEEVNQCMKRQLSEVESKLNAKYQSVLKALSEPDDQVQEYSASKKAVIESQKSWLEFRRKDCAAQSTMLLPPTGFGAYSMHTQCLIDYANIRIKRLNTFDPDTFNLDRVTQ